jgi:hypothetical protein
MNPLNRNITHIQICLQQKTTYIFYINTAKMHTHPKHIHAYTHTRVSDHPPTTPDTSTGGRKALGADDDHQRGGSSIRSGYSGVTPVDGSSSYHRLSQPEDERPWEQMTITNEAAHRSGYSGATVDGSSSYHRLYRGYLKD